MHAAEFNDFVPYYKLLSLFCALMLAREVILFFQKWIIPAFK